MPNERTRAVIQTSEFLLELSRDPSLPERIRRDAKFLLRHYPDQFQMLLAGRIEEDLNPLIWPMCIIADPELTHMPTWRCPISIQPKVRPANSLRSRSLGQRNFASWVNSTSAATGVLSS
ncbi:BPSL0761 family protein [Pseudomonas syringae]|uniref:BPSL0761 family protein n=1 Tax=Pseudomonas syringae TaxID=317 RepID=UPI000CDAE572|nr:BPSL0761 family protein [Pseudomonas syringae]POP75306.1 hypothetical protein CXB37_15870 [Pseudomonas syringae pv. syringae]